MQHYRYIMIIEDFKFQGEKGMKKRCLLFTIAFAFPGSAYACDGGYSHWWGGGHMMGFGYRGIFSWLILIVLIGFIIYLVLQNSKLKKQKETPLDILKIRYAKGEITKDEFENIKKGLTE